MYRYINFDLLYEKLKASTTHSKLTGLLYQYKGLCSAKVDLEHALKCINAVEAMAPVEPVAQPRAQTDLEAITIGSIFVHSLILYCRATATTSDHRVNLEIRHALSPEQREAHDSLVRLRNDGIAHFGESTEHVHGRWASDRIYLRVDETGYGLRHRYTRTNYYQETYLQLAGAIDSALEVAKLIMDKKESKLLSELENVGSSDPEFENLFLSCEMSQSEHEADAQPVGMTLYPSGTSPG